MSPKILALIIAAAAALWIAAAIVFPGSDPAGDEKTSAISQTSDGETLQAVRVREMAAEPFHEDLVVTGRSQASRSVMLRAEITGRVEEILKEEGDTFAKGDSLARLELLDRQARLQEARERVQQREIEYNAARELETQGYNSTIRLAQARADLENARALLEQARIAVEKTDIKAPFDGVLAEQFVEIGDFLGIADPVFNIVDLDPIEFEAFISERNVQSLKTGSQVRIVFLEGEKVTGTLTYISPAADSATRTFRVVVEAKNPDHKVKEGLTAEIHIPLAEKPAHRISPAILSLDEEGRVGVKIVNAQNIVEFVPVDILSSQPRSMWVTGAPDEVRVITVGQEFVRTGQQVRPVPAEGGGLL